jgi:hypothetical protein
MICCRFYFAFFTMPMTGMFTRMADGNHGNGGSTFEIKTRL